MKSRCPSRKGFTLIELMVVVTIIAVLAALIVPALQKAQAAAMARQCMSRARSIAASIRAYASNWDGWTNIDRDYYVKEFGYKLSSELGYEGEAAGTWADDSTTQSYQRHGMVGDFRCPVDEAPSRNSHAILSSYGVSKFFAGTNVMNQTAAANRILAVKEVGKRHTVGGSQNELEAHYVMADMSTTLGFKGDYLPGAVMRIWHRSRATSATVKGVSLSSLPDPDMTIEIEDLTETNYMWGHIVSSAPTASDYGETWKDDPATNNPNAHHWTNRSGGRSQYPNNICARVDCLIKFPTAGTYRFRTLSSDHVLTYLGIGDKGAPMDTDSYTWDTGNRPWDHWSDSGAGWFTVPEDGSTHPLQFVMDMTGGWWMSGYYVRWHNVTTDDPPTNTDIPADRLFSVP